VPDLRSMPTLQQAGFTLAMAAGVHVGVAAWKGRGDHSLRSIAGIRIPGWSLGDAGWLYVLVSTHVVSLALGILDLNVS